MTTKNVDWNAMKSGVGNSLNKIHLDRSNLSAAFDLIRETIKDHLCLYVDKRHIGGFRIEIETADREIHAHLRFEGKTLCGWVV